VARMVEGRGVYRVLVRRPEGKRPLGRPRRRWEMDLREIGSRGELDSAGSVQCPVAGLREHGNEPSDSIRNQDIF
jgi:hypothetical protein